MVVTLTMPLIFGLSAGFVCGAEPGSPVCDRYEPPFKFTGTIRSVTIDVSGHHVEDPEHAMKVIIARQ